MGAYGHRSHLIYFSEKEKVKPSIVTTFAPIKPWPSTIDYTTLVVEQTISKFKPDIAYVHILYHPDLLSWLAQRLPTVAYVHGPYPVCPGSGQFLRKSSRICPHKPGLICMFNAQVERCCWGYNPINHLKLLARVNAFIKVYKKLDTILVGSSYLKRLIERTGIESRKIVIHPPILFRKPNYPLSFNQNSRTVLFAGRLVPEKGLHLLIEALAGIKNDWQLLVAGDGEQRGRYQMLAELLDVADKVHFKGWLSVEEMDAALEECACVAVPSVWPEPFGRIGPESFIYGRPVVAFDSGGITDWLKHGSNGYLVKNGNVSELGRRIEFLLDSPDIRFQMGKFAREEACNLWDVQTQIENLIHIFEKVSI